MKAFPFYKQLDLTDCGPTCLKIIAKFYGKIYSTEYLREKCHITREGVSVSGITDAADAIGLGSLAANVTFESLLTEVPLPCISYWRQRHFLVIYEVNKDSVKVADPAHGQIKYTKEEFLKGWTGNKFSNNDAEGLVILLEPTPKFFETDVDTIKANLGLKFMLPYLKRYGKYIKQLVLGLFVGSILQLALPFLTQSIVDYGIRYQNLNFIYLILIGQIMLFTSQAAISIIRSWLLLHLGSRVNISIASDFLNKMMKLPISFFDSKITGDIMQRVQDNQRIETFLSSQSLGLVFSAFNGIIFLFILFYYNYLVGLIFLLGTVIYIVWVMLFSKQREELNYRRFDESAGNSSSLIQIISGISEIKLNGSEKRRRWEWESVQVKLFKISVKNLSLANYQVSGAFFINELKNILITFFAAKSVLDGQITLGMMLAIQYIIGQLNAPLNSFIGFIQTAQDAKLSLERIGEIHDQDEENKNQDQNIEDLPQKKDILISNLKFRYGGSSSRFILDDINLLIPEGKVTAIVGPSGSGKTTLLKVLLKFYNPSEGTIHIGNSNLENIGTSFWRKNCGVVMQDGYIFTDTLLRNITESDSERILDKARLQKSVNMANIDEFVEGLPAGYNSRIGTQGTSGVNVSGGQKQRILIARAIYKNPNFLFFDEATSSLDANNEKVIMEAMNEYFIGKTVLVIAHRLSTVKKADQIVVLDKGKITEIGTHLELTEKRGAYYNLVKNQLELGN
jgi:ATP-binding cassette, subfamily B, bacterial